MLTMTVMEEVQVVQRGQVQNEYRWRHGNVSNEPYNKKSSSEGTYRTRCVKRVRGLDS